MALFIALFTRRAALVAAAAAACYGLAEGLGAGPALLLWAAAAAGACVLGAVLLRVSAVGRITWRNRAAGYLIPWGWRLNRGRLWPVAVVSWVVWVAVGAAALLLRPSPGEDGPAVGVRIALFAAWAVDAAALVFILGSIRQATPGGRVGSLWKLVAVIAGLVGASVALHLGDLSRAALLLAGGPPAVLIVIAALFVGLMMTVGRNARWN
ncbi:hypothetical protein GobsT_13420 [Gemmata obscuriglobus]|uniref:Uncharacterized protein n=1 Tax=Gemmata obscuriglobus TaxID=114 RepID=A0A2Z3H5P6_9BACT|nr:hypothetical protein [Gemmata obscuriglobus]AWM40211.1 hypothetical protein C1280_26540 [Gemmata obscuriglobus]QEG26599.1 hypothetical protein GobsT_13420 [Gemmata obscuriglobus]VTS02086.1 unnamed protein product [Gemmata obscuriglobus UQM 2246]